MKKVIKVVAAVCAFIVAYAFVSAAFRSISSHLGGSPSIEAMLQAASRSINAKAPMKVDEETRLDTTTVGPGKRLSYHYTLTNTNRDAIDPEQFIQAMRPQLLETYRTHPQMEAFRKANVELNYIYQSKEGEPITAVMVSPADFPQP